VGQDRKQAGRITAAIKDLGPLQWQAQDVPQPPAAVSPPDDEEALSGDEDDAGADSDAASAVAPAAAGAAPPEPPRKSVAYQPEPLSWNPAAVTCFLKDSAPQAGQVLSTGSDIFCKTSLA